MEQIEDAVGKYDRAGPLAPPGEQVGTIHDFFAGTQNPDSTLGLKAR
jgi:hypothetical protein